MDVGGGTYILVLEQVYVYIPSCLGMVTIVFSHSKTPGLGIAPV